MRKKSNYRSLAAFGGRMPKMFIVMMLALMMTVSGIAPYFCVYAEDNSGEAAAQTEEAAPAEVKAEEPAPAPEPAPEPEKEPEPVAEAGSYDAVQNSADDNSEAETNEVSAASNDTEPSDTGSGKADITAAADDDQDKDKDKDKEEETKYPAQKFSASTSDLDISVSASEGVFPEGTKMKARAASAAEVMDAAQRLNGEGTEVVDAAAADITFHYEGREIQPKGSVKVNLSAKRTIAGDSHEAVTVSDNGSASVMSDASAGSASFRTDHFTVYGIIGTEDEPVTYEDEDVEQYIRHTYEFYAGEPGSDISNWGMLSEVTVRDGDSLEVPGNPSGDSRHSFEGWYVVAGNTEYTDTEVVSLDAVKITPATKKEAEEADVPAENKTIRVYAKYTVRYKVTLYTDNSMTTAYETYLGGAGETVPGDGRAFPKAEDEDFALPVAEGQSFAGWKIADTDDRQLVESVMIDVDDPRDIDLVPVIKDAVTVDFVVNAHVTGKDTYRDVIDMDIPSQNVPNGETATEPRRLSPGYEENGYRFTGWYRYDDLAQLVYDDNNARYIFDNSRKWNFADSVEESMTLYAGWEPQEIQYRIVIMQEKTGGANSRADYTEWMEAPGNCKAAIGTEYTALIDNARTYVNGVRESSNGLPNDSRQSLRHFHPSRTGAMNDEGSCPYWIQVEQEDGTCLAYMDAANGVTRAMVSQPGEDRIRGTSNIVVRIYENRNTYKMHIVYAAARKDGETTYTEGVTISNWSGSGGPVLKPEYAELLPDGDYETYGDLSDQVFQIRFRESLYRTIYQKSSKIQELMKTWFFVKYFGKFGGQTVFDQTNSGLNLIPEAGVEDGAVLFITLGQNDTYPHKFIFKHLNPDGKENADASSSTTIPYGKPHSHGFQIGDKGGGYLLDNICTGNTTYSTPSGQKGYKFEYDTNGDPKPMVLTYKPLPYTITFVPNDGSSSFRATNGKWENTDSAVFDETWTIEKKKAFFVGDSIANVVNEKNAAGEYRIGQRREIQGLTREFMGWYDNKDCTGEPFDFTGQTMPAKDLILYGKWEAKSVTVVFNPLLNGELNGEEAISRTYYIGEKVHPIRNPQRTEFVFSGWYLNEDASAGNKLDLDGTMLTEDKAKELDTFGGSAEDSVIHLYAKWNPFGPYAVVYHANGGILPDKLKKQLDGKDQDKSRYRGGSMATVRGVAVSSDDSLIFAGWEIGRPGSGNIVQNGRTFEAGIDNDREDGNEDIKIHLYAKYVEKDRKTHVTYHSNYPGGTDEQKTAEGPVINRTFRLMSPEDLSFGKTYTAENGTKYEFVCWTNSTGEQIYTNSPMREYFMPGETAAAGIQDNNLYAVWKETTEVKSDFVDAEDTGSDTGVLGDYEEENVKTADISQTASSKGVKTGDETRLIAYIGIMLAAVMTALAILIRRNAICSKKESDRH